MDKAWVHELRLRIWIRNTASKVLRITGIAPNKQVLDCKFKSAVAFQPQGAIRGDVVRFECNLDKDSPSMRRFNLDGTRRIYTSSEYYFDEGLPEVEPDHTECISILFKAENRMYEIFPEIVMELNGRSFSCEVPTNQRGIVCPFSLIPDDAKFVRTYNLEPPFFEINARQFDSILERY